jgi:U3 small nucleolar RNA-associated protein MPP10
VGRVIKEVGAGEAEADEDDEGNGGSEGEEGSEGEMTVEEFKRMIMEDGESEGSESGSESEGSDSETSEDEDSGESDESLDGNEFRLKGELGDEEDGDLSDEDEEDGDVEVEEGDEDDSEDEERELDEDNEIMDGDSRSASDEEVLAIDGMDDEAPGNDNTDDEAPGVDEDDETARFGAGPSRRRSRKTHPTLDDTFFSIDDFNRLTEEAEAGRVSAGRLGGDEDDEEELADVGSMMLQGGDQEDCESLECTLQETCADAHSRHVR